MKLVGPLAVRSPGLRLALAIEIESHCSADEILQGRLIDLVAFVDVDGAPGIFPNVRENTLHQIPPHRQRGGGQCLQRRDMASLLEAVRSAGATNAVILGG